MNYYDNKLLETLNKNSVYGYRVTPNGYGKVFVYCAKIFRDNDCKLVNLYVDTDIMSLFSKRMVYIIRQIAALNTTTTF